MGLFSLLPESLQTVETWIIRIFFLLAVVTFGPWIALLVYDIVLYLWRTATFDLPQFGGRARGRQRPRAPSLRERPDGHRRRFSLAGVAVPDTLTTPVPETDGLPPRSPKAPRTPTSATSSSVSGHKRKITATMSRPIFEFVDDDE